ncbi:putative mitogen-activated protein kinase kinase kinase STE-STE11 family [Helianthus debilis subsp. tardiflorus]
MEWTRSHVLGRGSSATVSAATSTSGDVFAVKSVDFRHAESLRKEQHFLSILKSPYVVSYKGCDTTIEDSKTIYNVFIDYMSGGSISDLIKRRNGVGLTDSEIARYTRQIVQGLDYIHSNGIVHCDIKSGNILIDESGAKIGDFGCAKWASPNKLARAHLVQHAPICGTPMYMAPETARGEDQGFPADVWAVGCTVIEMATGGSPWPDVNDPVSVLYKIAFSGEIQTIPDGLSDLAKDFVSKCLIRDPKQRWTATQLLKHPYIETEQFDENSKIIVCEKTRTDSPTSILDQDVWNSSSWVGIDGLCSTSNSLRQRIKQLADKSEMPKWRCEKGETDWVTIRKVNSESVTGGGR